MPLHTDLSQRNISKNRGMGRKYKLFWNTCIKSRKKSDLRFLEPAGKELHVRGKERPPILGISAEGNSPPPIHQPGHDTADGKRKKEQREVAFRPLLLHSLLFLGECFSVSGEEEEAPREVRKAQQQSD
jgi:hypothetical protein